MTQPPIHHCLMIWWSCYQIAHVLYYRCLVIDYRQTYYCSLCRVHLYRVDQGARLHPSQGARLHLGLNHLYFPQDFIFHPWLSWTFLECLSNCWNHEFIHNHRMTFHHLYLVTPILHCHNWFVLHFDDIMFLKTSFFIHFVIANDSLSIFDLYQL